MLIMLTGASGHIGRHVVRELLDHRHSLRVLLRTQQGYFPSTVDCIRWELGEDISPEYFNGVNALIHLAHDFSGKAGIQRSVDGTIQLFHQACQAGVNRQIFISSYSSGLHAKSEYGMAKYYLEQIFLKNEGLVVRPGLVLGEGGIFGRIRNIAQRWPVIPLPDGGKGEIPVITVSLLSKLLSEIVEGKHLKREFNLFESELVSLRKLVLCAANEVERYPKILPVPSQIILIGLKLLEIAKIKLPVNSDNLKGFLSNQGAEHLSSLTSDMVIMK